MVFKNANSRQATVLCLSFNARDWQLVVKFALTQIKGKCCRPDLSYRIIHWWKVLGTPVQSLTENICCHTIGTVLLKPHIGNCTSLFKNIQFLTIDGRQMQVQMQRRSMRSMAADTFSLMFTNSRILALAVSLRAPQQKRTNAEQIKIKASPIEMHWMRPQCSDRDASPNTGSGDSGQRPLCLPEWPTAGTRGDSRSETWQVLFFALLLQEATAELGWKRDKCTGWEGGRDRQREAMARVLPLMDRYGCVCVCVGGWAHVYLHRRTMGDLVQDWWDASGIMPGAELICDLGEGFMQFFTHYS